MVTPALTERGARKRAINPRAIRARTRVGRRVPVAIELREILVRHVLGAEDGYASTYGERGKEEGHKPQSHPTTPRPAARLTARMGGPRGGNERKAEGRSQIKHVRALLPEILFSLARTRRAPKPILLVCGLDKAQILPARQRYGLRDRREMNMFPACGSL